MKYILGDYENYLEKLKEFSELNWVKNYLELKVKPNFWTIIEYGRYDSSRDKSAHETRMSKMIRWMMDPNENHELANVFAYKLMNFLGEDYEYFPEKNKEIKTIAEYKDIDIFYKDLSQKICLAIELKQHAKEGQTSGGISQLDKYELIVEKLSKRKELKAHYIFLTPLKETPTNKKWHPLGYEELIDLIDEVNNEYILKSNSLYIKHTQKIIMDFRDELQRTLDIYKKDNSYISKELSLEEKEFTFLLAKEIREDTDSKHMDTLMKVNKEEDLNIKELIFLVEDHLYVQDHSPNDEVKILIRKIYNYLSEDKVLEAVPPKEYGVKETKTILKAHLLNSYGIEFVKMQLTQGKGQGINMYTKDNKYRIYLSGDKDGSFPNHGVQVLKNPKYDKVIRSDKLKQGSFKLKNNLILEDMIHDKDGNLLSFDQLMEDYLIPALVELSNKRHQL